MKLNKINVLFIAGYVLGGIFLEKGLNFESPAFFSFYGFCCAVAYMVTVREKKNNQTNKL